jgi:hypothetical protein
MLFGNRFAHGSQNMASTSGAGKGYKKHGKPDRRSLISSTNNHSAISQGMKKVEARGTTLEVRRKATKERKRAVVLSDEDEDAISPLEILTESTHRDGSLYNIDTHIWKRNYHVADRSESKWSIFLFLSFCYGHIFQNIGSTYVGQFIFPLFTFILQFKCRCTARDKKESRQMVFKGCIC